MQAVLEPALGVLLLALGSVLRSNGFDLRLQPAGCFFGRHAAVQNHANCLGHEQLALDLGNCEPCGGVVLRLKNPATHDVVGTGNVAQRGVGVVAKDWTERSPIRQRAFAHRDLAQRSRLDDVVIAVGKEETRHVLRGRIGVAQAAPR